MTMTLVYIIVAVLGMINSGCAPKNQGSAPTPTQALVSPTPVPSPAPCSDSSQRLLIIGDSISMGYTPYIQRDLCRFYRVSHVGYPDGLYPDLLQNAQGTNFVLQNLDRWLEQAGPLDVIVWNSGLWDAYDPNYDPVNATDPAAYRANLVEIANRLKATGARVLFFTTTDIPQNPVDPATGQTFIVGRDLINNQIANEVLPQLGVEVYDLNALARSNPKLHLSNDPIHFNAQGYSLFGEYISDMVRTDFENSN